MALDKKVEQELWNRYASDASKKFTIPEEGFEDLDEFVDEMTEFVTKYADEMLDQFDKRFSSGAQRRGRTRRAAEEENDEGGD